MSPPTRPLVVLNVVGLSPALLAHAPRLRAMAAEGSMAPLDPVLPAVTCSVQTTMLTGRLPRDHGIVGNGWYFRDLAQVWLWRQSHHLVAGETVWERARRERPGLRCAKLFWWYNMYSSADLSVTPRPAYLADGRKIPDVYSRPEDLGRRLQDELGTFPLFRFWGPAADIVCSRWIADAARRVFDAERPELSLVYLPHLDYCLQKLGPEHARVPAEVAAIDAVAGDLVDHCRAAGARVVVLSEYGIEAVSRPIHINRRLREAGLLAVHTKLGRELLDAGASRAFAVADHQLAHVYVADPADVPRAREALAVEPGVELLDAAGKAAVGLDHPRSGELIAIAPPGAWFTYYYWTDDARAPDFARTVAIHDKPGYDPVELFLDPALRAPKLSIAWRLLKKTLGFRTLMDLIPLDATLVRGSHGRAPSAPELGPLILSHEPLRRDRVAAAEVFDLLLGWLLEA